MPESASLPRERLELIRRQQRQLRHVADDDAPAAPVRVGQFAHQMDVHRVRRVADIEMDIDDRHRTRAPARRCAGSARARPCRSAAHHRAPLAPRLSPSTSSSSVPGIADQALPAETRRSRCRSPTCIRRSAPRRRRIRACRCPGSTSICVRMRVAPCRMHCSSVAAARACTSSTVMAGFTGVTPNTGLSVRARLRRAAVDDARLVEMDVRLDQAGAGTGSRRHHAPAHRRRAAARSPRCGRSRCRCPAASPGAVGEPRVADDEVEQVLLTPP